MNRRVCLSVLAVLLLAGTVARTASTTYYVSTTGSDSNNGLTTGAPFLTIRHAVGLLHAGDALYLRGGTYAGTNNTISDQVYTIASGTAGNPITISGYPGETVIIQNPDGTDAIHLREASHSYITFQDLIIDGSLGTNHFISANVILENAQDHIRFVRVEVKDSWYTGVANYPSGDSHIEYIDCSMHGNGRQPDNEEAAGNPGTSGDGIYSVSNGTLFEGLNVYGNHGYGVYFSGNDNILRNSKIHDNGTTILGPGQILGTNYGVDIGAGVYPSSARNLVYNNLIYNNRGGIQVYTHSSDTGIYNNTLYGNGPSPAVAVQYIGGDVTFRNNIIFGNTDNQIVNYGGFSGGSIIEDHSLYTNPSFTNAGAADFTLQAGSAALNAGTPIASFSTDYLGIARGAQWDDGAYERTSTCTAANTAALTACIASSALGDTIFLTAGTVYDGPFDLPDKGAGSNYITITTTGFAVAAGTRVGPGNASTMAKIRTTGTGAALYTRFSAHHWQLIGVELTATFNDGLGTPQYGLFTMGFDGAVGELAHTTSQLPTDIIIDRCYVHGTTTGQHVHGTMANAIRPTIKNSYYTNFHAGGADAQDIIVFLSPGPGTFDNNYLEASGQSILFGGSGSFVPVGVSPSDFTVTNNLMTKSMTWRAACVTGAELNCNGAVYDGSNWVVKNIFEIKNGQRITVDHNILKNNWTSGQFGEAFVLTPRNQVGSNTISAVAGGASSITFPGSASSVTDAYLGASITINGGTGNVNYQTRDVTAYNGTTKVATVSPAWSVAPNATSTFVYGWPSWAKVQDCVFSNNVIIAVDTIVNLQGWDNQRPSVENEHNTFTNNLAYSFNTGGRGIHTQRSAEYLTFTHNTWDLSAGAVDILVVQNQTANADGIFIPTPAGAPETIRGWVFDDNIITRSGTYEINGDSTSGNNALTISTFFISPSWQKNLFGGMAGSIPAGGSTAPSTATILANLRSPSTGDYRLTVGSAYLTASSTGGALGVNMCALPDPAGVGNTTFSCSGDGGGFTPPPSPPAPPAPAGPVRLRFR